MGARRRVPLTSTVAKEDGKPDLPEDPGEEKKIVLRELKERSFWFLRLRWWVPFSIGFCAACGRMLGFQFDVFALFLIAGYVLVYNTVLHVISKRIETDPYVDPRPIQYFTYTQVGLDYSCMFLLIHYTGGTISPVLFFFLFHIIFASILLPLRSAYWFAVLAALGTSVIVILEYFQVIARHRISYEGLLFEPGKALGAVELGFFMAALFITAYSTTQIMGILRKRIIALSEANEAIEEFNRERSRFMMRVAHDLRAPLVAMCSMLDVVRGGYKGDLNADQKQHLDRIDRRAHGMIAMVTELMALAQSTRGKPEQNFVTVNLKAVSDRIRRTFADEAAEKALTLTIGIPADIPSIRGDLSMIEQLFENLVSNAIKYTPPGGRVDVKCSCEEEGKVKIEVSDTGIGIPEADIPKLFSEFFRSKNARKMETLGTGLGLAITKGIVDAHDGRIQVKSELNKGTVFSVELPAMGDTPPSG